VSKGLQANLAFENRTESGLAGVTPARRLDAWDPTAWKLAGDWVPTVQPFLESSAGRQLGVYIQQRQALGAVIYPPEPFRALALTSLADVRVVILGQDPYHGAGQAHGLAFSVASAVKPPPSLRNIFKELARDPRVEPEKHPDGSLERWAMQGVLLLNTCLTVEEGQAASHAKQGWEALTNQLISAVSAKPEPVAFMLWGAHAQAKQVLIAARHEVLLANHPSPLSALRLPRPFIGCGHFSAANDFLRSQGRRTVKW
jgi:uracil-DNA glycosylase